MNLEKAIAEYRFSKKMPQDRELCDIEKAIAEYRVIVISVGSLMIYARNGQSILKSEFNTWLTEAPDIKYEISEYGSGQFPYAMIFTDNVYASLVAMHFGLEVEKPCNSNVV